MLLRQTHLAGKDKPYRHVHVVRPEKMRGHLDHLYMVIALMMRSITFLPFLYT